MNKQRKGFWLVLAVLAIAIILYSRGAKSIYPTAISVSNQGTPFYIFLNTTSNGAPASANLSFIGTLSFVQAPVNRPWPGGNQTCSTTQTHTGYSGSNWCIISLPSVNSTVNQESLNVYQINKNGTKTFLQTLLFAPTTGTQFNLILSLPLSNSNPIFNPPSTSTTVIATSTIASGYTTIMINQTSTQSTIPQIQNGSSNNAIFAIVIAIVAIAVAYFIFNRKH